MAPYFYLAAVDRLLLDRAPLFVVGISPGLALGVQVCLELECSPLRRLKASHDILGTLNGAKSCQSRL